MRGLSSNLTFIFNINFWKGTGACFSRAGVLVASALFQWCVRRHRLFENNLLSCPLKRRHVLFLLVWSVSVVVWRFVTDGRFFFLLPTFFSLMVKVNVCPFFLLVFQFQYLCFLLLIFILDPFRIVSYVFNLILKLQFVIYCFCQFGPYSFDLSFLPVDLLLNFY
jgi:hypothetical protein